MSDRRDAWRPDPSHGRPDDTVPGGPAGYQPDDRTHVGGAPFDDRTRVTPSGPPDSTSVMPPDDDWAQSRGNPVWSGRAEVRSSQPVGSVYDTDWSTGPVPQQRDRWWLPIVMGIVVLVLLAVLGWAVYVIAQNAGGGGGQPAPAPTTAATTARTLSTESAPPAVEPTTTTPDPLPSTTDPTDTEVTVPALRGLPLADAQAALARVGLGARVIRRPSDAPPGTVIDSDPAEGQEVPPDTRVTLVVAQASTAAPTVTATTTAAPADGAD